MERVRNLNPERLKRFLQRGTGAQDVLVRVRVRVRMRVRVRPELRKIVTFERLNLLDDRWQIGGPFDAVFCRKVMIHFNKPTQGKILSRLAPLMKKDGLLFAGHSENFLYVSNAFKLHAKTIYELAKA